MVLQLYAAGVLVFGGPTDFHAVVGSALIPLSLLAALLAAIAFRGHRVTWWSTALAGMVIMQPVFVYVLSGVSIYITALHPLSGTVALWLSVVVALRVRRELRLWEHSRIAPPVMKRKYVQADNLDVGRRP
jgi:heme A synthase